MVQKVSKANKKNNYFHYVALVPALFVLIFLAFIMKKIVTRVLHNRGVSENVSFLNTFKMEPLHTSPGIQQVALGFFLLPDDYRANRQKDFSTYDSRATSITMNWSSLEPKKGEYNWKNLDRLVDLILSASPNTKILLHVRSQAPWAIEKPCDQYKNAEMPAQNSADWEEFMEKLASEYKGRITMYALSNEAASPVNWGGCETNPSETYASMLRSMYKAVKKADPNALITNDGMSSGLLAYMYGYRNIFQNNKTAGISYFNSVVEHHVPGGFSINPTEQSIQHMHESAFGQYAEPFWDMLVENQQYFDVVSLHWYQPSAYLIDIMPWVQEQFPDKPLQLWETSYAWDQNNIPGQTYGNYNVDEQADETAKLLTIGAAYGNWVQLWPWTSIVEDAGKFPVGAVNIKSNPPVYKPAASAFKVLGEQLNGATFESRPNFGVDTVAFHFKKDDKDIYVIWSKRFTTININDRSTSVETIDLKGNIRMQNPHNMQVGISPIIIRI